MRQKGFWAFICITLFFAFGFSGDTYVHKEQVQEPVVKLAAVSMQTDIELVDVQPGRVPMEEQHEQTEPAFPDENAPEEPIQFHSTEDDMDENDSLILTLLTFNIHSANNVEGSVDLEQIIEEIRETGAEIIGLQEVERMMPRSGYQDQARVIAEELGFHYYYGGNINILGVQYGNAFLSKYPIITAKNHKLPKEKLEPRGLIEAQVDVEGSPYHVYVTHLGLNPLERNKQIQYINDTISKIDDNVLLMGDFNNQPDGEEIGGLDVRMVDSAAALDKANQYTFSNWSDTPNVRIDRIYTSDRIDIKQHEVRPSAVSDHLRVITQIVHKIIPGEGIYNAMANTDSNGDNTPIVEWTE